MHMRGNMQGGVGSKASVDRSVIEGMLGLESNTLVVVDD